MRPPSHFIPQLRASHNGNQYNRRDSTAGQNNSRPANSRFCIKIQMNHKINKCTINADADTKVNAAYKSARRNSSSAIHKKNK